MATRSTKSASAATKPTIVEDGKAQSAESCADETFSAYSEMFNEALAIKHPWMGTIVNLSVFAFGAYTGVQAAMWLGFMATVLTTSAFIGGLITFIVALIAIVQSLRLGAAAGRYVSTGQFEEDYQSAKTWVGDKLSFFKREPKAV